MVKRLKKPFYLEERRLEDLEKILQRWMLVLEVLTHITGLKKLDLSISTLTKSTQRGYKGGWNLFILFFIKNNEPFPNWNDEDECIVIFGDFISWFLSNNKLSELNITSSAISKMFQWLFPKLAIAKLPEIISLKKKTLINHPKQVKYLQIWEADILLSYYQKTSTPTSDDSERYNFLQKKIAIFLGFFFMLRPFEAYQTKISNNSEYKLDSQSGFWLVTNIKNKKLLLSNIWIPNMMNFENENNSTNYQGNKNNENSLNLNSADLLNLWFSFKQTGVINLNPLAFPK
jgi:hypothetical protein